jgi:hypothetical protein
MATSNIDIKVTGVGDLDKATDAINAGAGSVTNLKTQLRTLQQELQTLDPSSDKFIELSQKAGELRDKIKDTSEAVNANAGPAFERLGNNASLLTSKLGSLDFGGASESVKALAANVKGVDFKTLGAEIGTFGKSLVQLGRALLANPIFLLAAAVAAIILNFDTLLKLLPSVDAAISGVSVELSQALIAQEKLTQEARNQLEATTAQENILKLQGLTEKQILGLKQAQTKELIASLKNQQALQDQITMAQIEAAKRNRDILAGILEFIAIPIRALLTQIDLVGEVLGKDFGLVEGFQKGVKSIAELAFNPEELLANAKKTKEENAKAIRDLENQQAGYQISLNNIEKQGEAERKKNADDAAAKRKKEEEEQLKSAEEVSELIAQLEKETLEETRKAEFEANQKRLQQQEDYYNLSNELNSTETEKEIDALVKAYDEKFLLAEGNAELEAQLQEDLNNKIDKINEDAAKKQAEKEKEKRDTKVQLAGSAIDALIALNNAFEAGNEKAARKQFAINKALSLAQALQNTYLGATAAFAQTPGGIGIKIAAASIATAAGLANVLRIARSKFEPSGGGGGDTGGGGAPSIGNGGGGAVDQAANPQFSALNPAFLGSQGNGTPPVQAYVLGGDVSDELNAQERIRDQSTL